MSAALSAIIDLKIDISIKNRKKTKTINLRHQVENPFGDKFEMPEKCSRFHPAKNKNFKCCLFDYRDVMDFRSQLYKSLEKRDQEDFLGKFLNTVSSKNHQKSFVRNARMITVFYSLQKHDGETISVCKDLFEAVTGVKGKRLRRVINTAYKRKLLLEGDEDLAESPSDHNENDDTATRLIQARKERLLSLKKGTYESFAKAIIQKKQSQKRQKQRENPIPDDAFIEYIDEEDEIEDQTPIIITMIDVDQMESCRICLNNDSDLISVFEKSDDYSIAEMIEYCLITKVTPADNLPLKICQNCLTQVKNACYLKTTFLESQQIMEECCQDHKIYEIPDSSEVFEDYVTQEEVEEIIFDQMDEELLIEETPVDEGEEDTDEPPTIPSHKLQPTKCFLCNVDFETTAEDHFSNSHNLIEISRCTKCVFETEYPWFMNLHYQHHEESFKLCPYCGKKFQTKRENFSSHKTRCSANQKNIGRTFSCQFCDAVFTKSRSVRDHVRVVHTQEKPLICTECGEKFALRIFLRRHLMKHGIGATCCCSGCGKAYLQRYELVRHQRTCLVDKKF